MTHLKFIKSYLKVVPFFASLLSPFPSEAKEISQSHKTIGITQIVNHPSLNAIRDGIVEELKKEGFVQGENLTIIFESAQGNPSLAAQIAQKFASISLDAIIPISTPSAQAMVKQIKDKPIIFAAISDPLGSKIVSSLDHPGGNVTGVTDTPPLAEQLNFIQTCIPKLKTLGVIYNPGEANNVSLLKDLKSLAKGKDIIILTAAVSKSADVKTAARSLVTDVDAIFVGNDNTVISGLEALVKTCLDEKKPLFVSDPDSVERGALAAYAYDQRQMGRQIGDMVVEILKGKNPGDMPVQRATDLKFSLNPETAKELHITCAIAN